MLAEVIELYPNNHINKYEEAAKSENTKNAYGSDWTHYDNWCQSLKLKALPSAPQTVIDYIEFLADQGFKYSTIKRRVSSIVDKHKKHDFEPPKTYRVAETLKGIRRKIGGKQTPKQSIILEELPLLVDQIDTSTLTGKRDKTIILLGFALCSRRSELVSLNVEDISFVSKGIDVSVDQTKTMSIERKSVVYAHNNYCAIKALQEWLVASGINEGAIFRSINKSGKLGNRLSDKTVVLLVKKYVELAGLDPSLYASHSLRRGHATSAGEKKYNQSAIMKQGGWNSVAMANHYQGEGQRFENNTSAILRLL
ncbi:site-specific integrase [Paenibacillus elgii]|uniref:site-specific integrase n=1 Tax=Paenibacillus elgii TaxID=189691 RepID=UPI00203C77CB|nr:site-specific integrase [Paenibacillus elgii]MCM3273049.1 site-specific integrase [Paenibacillus elgii]